MADLKCRNFLGVIYPDSESYSCDSVLLALDSIFTEWSYILHDRDTDENGEVKKPHIHWVGKRKTPVPISTISNALGVPSNSIEFCKKYKAAIRYLIHADNVDKFQYDAVDVKSNFDVGKYLFISDETEMARSIFNYIIENDCTSVVELTNYVISNGLWSDFRRSFAVYAAVMNEIKNLRK